VGTGAPLILLDEPSAALDDGGVAALAGLLRARVSGGAAALVATHDPRLRAALDWQDVVVLRSGARSPPEVP
jgi:ABC-type transport system involved in cytochrome c biogenesis ATPase subunit